MNEQRRKFIALIRRFYTKNRRDLPWRRTTDPYHILVSEVMLQQTQVSRVEKKYSEFLRAFPTVKKLAAAPTSEVLKVWQGMGYNRRALALKHAAEVIVRKHKGKVPSDPTLLEALPGIGHYTARAICAFAFNHPDAFIETNIRRVYIHHFFSGKSDISDNELLPLIEATLDRKDPRIWYSALMDYGATLPKTTINPNRRSKHYTKQKPFKGSTREVRGKIIRTLTEHGPQTLAALKREVASPLVADTMRTLTQEGFIQKVGRTFSLA